MGEGPIVAVRQLLAVRIHFVGIDKLSMLKLRMLKLRNLKLENLNRIVT